MPQSAAAEEGYQVTWWPGMSLFGYSWSQLSDQKRGQAVSCRG